LDAGKGSIQILTSYAGNIFDKETATFNLAASAITGSGDNQFISGSASVMLYGGLNSAKHSFFNNNLVSGSSEKGYIEASDQYGLEIRGSSAGLLLDAADTNRTIKLFANDNQAGEIRLNDGNSNGIAFYSGSNDRPSFQIRNEGVTVRNGTGDSAAEIKLHSSDANSTLLKSAATGARTITFPADASITNYILQATDINGTLQWASAGSVATANLKRSVLNVKSRVKAGITNVILTGSGVNPSEISEFFEDVTPYTGSITSTLDGVSDAELNDRLEIYVNGQLLTSGAYNANGVSTQDYGIISRSSSVLSGAFAFDLEVDDIVTIVSR
jgi:hypothetical protein